MFSNRLAFASLFLGCVFAAAGGGYLATRHVAESDVNAAPSPNEGSTSPATSLPVTAPSGSSIPEAQSGSNDASAAAQSAFASTSIASHAAGKDAASSAPVVGSRASHRPDAGAERKTRTQPAATFSPPLPSASAPASDPQLATVATPEPPSPEVTAPASPSHSAEARPIAPETHAAEVETKPKPTFEELVVTADSVVGLEIETTVSSERARVEDSVDARVARDVQVGRRVAIPAGSRVLGSVVAVDRGGKFKDRARLGVRFHTLLLTDGSRLPIATETIYRYGQAPGDGSAKKIGGGAVAGAILGALIGGAKGAAIGATAGAGGGTAVVMTAERSAATFVAGSEVTARFTAPVSVTVDH